MTSRRSIFALALTLVLFAIPALAQSPLDNPAALREQAPATFKVRFDTSKGLFVVEVTRAWAPKGADRFYNLVKNGFYDNVRFFRVISGFMVQFGINGDPATMARWRTAQISDDPVSQSNKRGTITFATAGPNTRTSQVFINFADNSNLDGMGFAPFGRIVSGMNVVDVLNAEYGEGAPRGRGPNVVLGCMLAYLVKNMGMSLPLGIVIVLLLGILLGFVNGFFSSYGRIPSFIVTLATMNIYRGLAFALTGGITIFSVSPQLDPIFYGRFLGIPNPFYYVVILYGSAALFLRYTIPGRAIYAIGGNEAAARLSGINVNRTRLLAFVIAGFTAAIAGVLETAWLDSGSAAYGSELALGGIAAAVIGGASLVGGYANIVSSLVGALTVAVVQNGLNLHAVQLAWQDVTLGLVIILAVGVDMWRGKISESLGRLFRRRAHQSEDSMASTPNPSQQV